MLFAVSSCSKSKHELPPNQEDVEELERAQSGLPPIHGHWLVSRMGNDERLGTFDISPNNQFVFRTKHFVVGGTVHRSLYDPVKEKDFYEVVGKRGGRIQWIMPEGTAEGIWALPGEVMIVELVSGQELLPVDTGIFRLEPRKE